MRLNQKKLKMNCVNTHEVKIYRRYMNIKLKLLFQKGQNIPIYYKKLFIKNFSNKKPYPNTVNKIIL